IQEVVTIMIFVIFSLVFFKTQSFNYNHLIAFILLIGAVYFVFR
ncbi:MAG: DMT family protein, partial [Bacteroidales bacterium]|nr:DMT family protein [Bacteroidales bacterium]